MDLVLHHLSADRVVCCIMHAPECIASRSIDDLSVLLLHLIKGMQWCRGNSLAERLPACTAGGTQMPSSAIGATGRAPESASCALAAAAAQDRAALPAELAEAVAPACGTMLAPAAAKPATVHTATSDCSAPPAAEEGIARHTGDSSEAATINAPQLLSPADMVAALSKEPRETRLERSHAVLELAASPANRRRLVQRRSAAAAAAAASAAPAPRVEPEPAPGAGSEPALAGTSVLEPAALSRDAARDRPVPAPQPARAPEPAVQRQVLSPVGARPSVPLDSAAELGRPLAGSTWPAHRQHDTAPSLQQPKAIGAAAPPPQDSKATAVAPNYDGTAPAVKHAPPAEGTAQRQPSPAVREMQRTTRDRVIVEAASGSDVVPGPSTAKRGISNAAVAANKTTDDSCQVGQPASDGLQPPVPAAAPLTAAVLAALAAADAAQVNALPSALISAVVVKTPSVHESSALRESHGSVASSIEPIRNLYSGLGAPSRSVNLWATAMHPGRRWGRQHRGSRRTICRARRSWELSTRPCSNGQRSSRSGRWCATAELHCGIDHPAYATIIFYVLTMR